MRVGTAPFVVTSLVCVFAILTLAALTGGFAWEYLARPGRALYSDSVQTATVDVRVVLRSVSVPRTYWIFGRPSADSARVGASVTGGDFVHVETMELHADSTEVSWGHDYYGGGTTFAPGLRVRVRARVRAMPAAPGREDTLVLRLPGLRHMGELTALEPRVQTGAEEPSPADSVVMGYLTHYASPAAMQRARYPDIAIAAASAVLDVMLLAWFLRFAKRFRDT